MSINAGITPTAAPTSLAELNSSELGWSGPLGFSVNNSSTFGPYIDTNYLLAINPLNALLFEIDLGGNEYRVATTLGHQLNTSQRVKLTLERLGENINYQFFSGNEKYWSQQNALGGSYQLLINHGWLKAFNLNSYYAKANSKTLTPLFFDDNAQLDLRDIAGGTSTGANAGLNFELWKNSLLTTTLNYDSLIYPTRYQPADNSAGFGTTLQYQQLLTNRLKFQLSESDREIYQETKLQLFWLLPTAPDKQIEMGFLVSHLHSNSAAGNDNRVGLTFNFKWKQRSQQALAYAAPILSNENLLSWTRTPAVHMDQVLTKVDQKILQVETSPILNTPTARSSNVITTVINVHPGEMLNLKVTSYFSNPNQSNQSSNITVATLPLGLQYEPQAGLIHGMIPANSMGNYPIYLHAATSNLLQQQKELILQVTDQSDAPIVKQQIPDQTATEGVPFRLSLDKNQLFTNPLQGWQTMTLSVSGLPSNFIASPSNDVSLIIGVPNSQNVQQQFYAVTVTANNGFQTSQTFLLTITSNKPSFVGPNLQGHNGQENQSYTPIATASSFSGDNLTFSSNGLPPGLSINSSNGIISGIPAAATAGTYNNVSVTATNSNGSATSNVFSIVILPASPSFIGPAIQNYSGQSGQAFTPIDTAPLFSGDHLTFSASNLPPGITINSNSGIISGIPIQTGTYNNIVVTASNSSGKAVSNNFSITIAAIGYLPCPGDGSTRTVSDGVKTYTFNGNGVGSWWQANLQVNGTQATLTCYYTIQNVDTTLTTTISASQISYANGGGGGYCNGSTDNCKVKINY